VPASQYWDLPVGQQSEAATGARVMEFLAKIDA
jgi:hypothetical protein